MEKTMNPAEFERLKSEVDAEYLAKFKEQLKSISSTNFDPKIWQNFDPKAWIKNLTTNFDPILWTKTLT